MEPLPLTGDKEKADKIFSWSCIPVSFFKTKQNQTENSSLGSVFLFFLFCFKSKDLKYTGEQHHLVGPGPLVACGRGGWARVSFPLPVEPVKDPTPCSSLTGATASSTHLLGMGRNTSDKLQVLQSVLKKAPQKCSAWDFYSLGWV